MKRFVLVILLVLAPAIGFFIWVGSNDSQQHAVACSLGIVVLGVVLALGLLELATRGNSSNTQRQELGYLEIVLGADGRVSTSKTVIAVWTLVFASALLFLSAMVWIDGLSTDKAFGGDWDPYLLLLGGPFAAGVLSKAITVGQLAKSPDAKSSTTSQSSAAAATTVQTADAPQISDIVSNDAGETDLVDTQYFVFSLVAVAYFLGAFVRVIVKYPSGDLALPAIPPALLGLTSLAALTYVGNKTTQYTGLSVVSISSPVAASAQVTVTLQSLPSNATGSNTTVIVGSADQSSSSTISSAEVAATVGPPATVTFPAPERPGDYQVTVVPPGGVAGPLSLVVTSSAA